VKKGQAYWCPDGEGGWVNKITGEVWHKDEHNLGKDGHGQRQPHFLGKDGHGQRQPHFLGKDGHGQRKRHPDGKGKHGKHHQHPRGKGESLKKDESGCVKKGQAYWCPDGEGGWVNKITGEVWHQENEGVAAAFRKSPSSVAFSASPKEDDVHQQEQGHHHHHKGKHHGSKRWLIGALVGAGVLVAFSVFAVLRHRRRNSGLSSNTNPNSSTMPLPAGLPVTGSEKGVQHALAIKMPPVATTML